MASRQISLPQRIALRRHSSAPGLFIFTLLVGALAWLLGAAHLAVRLGALGLLLWAGVHALVLVADHVECLRSGRSSLRRIGDVLWLVAVAVALSVIFATGAPFALLWPLPLLAIAAVAASEAARWAAPADPERVELERSLMLARVESLLTVSEERAHGRVASMDGGVDSGSADASGAKAPVQQAGWTVRIPPRAARFTFADVAGMRDVLDQMHEIGAPVKSGQPKKPNGIMLYGDPGNGKTMFAEAMAGELKLPIFSVTMGRLRSTWVGGTTENLRRLFADVRESRPCVLFLDEFEAFALPRTEANNSEDRTVTTFLLDELAQLHDSTQRVVVIAATNHRELVDNATIRDGRFDKKILIDNPDAPARRALLDKPLADAGLRIDTDVLARHVVRWEGFSVARLRNVAREVVDQARRGGRTQVDADDLYRALRAVQPRTAALPEDAPSLDDLVLAPELREQLEEWALTMRHIDANMALGGKLQRGIVFHGPPGTGKTATARALAKSCGWNFIATVGYDVIRDVEAFEKLVRQALDMRPTIVFIDEADDILRDRGTSPTGSQTNKILEILDGARAALHDVVFIAATNFPETLDGGAVRYGRFGAKAEFLPPGPDETAALIARWVKSRPGVEFEVPLSDAGRLLSGQAHASIVGAMQAAVDRAAARSLRLGQRAPVTHDDVVAAITRLGLDNRAA